MRRLERLELRFRVDVATGQLEKIGKLPSKRLAGAGDGGNVDDSLLPVPAACALDELCSDVPVHGHIAAEQIELDEAVELGDVERPQLALRDAARRQGRHAPGVELHAH